MLSIITKPDQKMPLGIQLCNRDMYCTFTDMKSTVGAVTCMRWTPDGTALAMAWKKGGFALWSVFGSLLACTVGGDYR